MITDAFGFQRLNGRAVRSVEWWVNIFKTHQKNHGRAFDDLCKRYIDSFIDDQNKHLMDNGNGGIFSLIYLKYLYTKTPIDAFYLNGQLLGAILAYHTVEFNWLKRELRALYNFYGIR